jgi:hypothetical protein
MLIWCGVLLSDTLPALMWLGYGCLIVVGFRPYCRDHNPGGCLSDGGELTFFQENVYFSAITYATIGDAT